MTYMTKARMEQMKENNHLRYAEAASMPNVITAIRRIIELQPLQSDKSLMNTDARWEYTALLNLVHDIAWGNGAVASSHSLGFWEHNRELALVMLSWSKEPARELPPQEHITSLNSILKAHHEQNQRNSDTALAEAAMRMIEEGTIMDIAVPMEQSEQAKAFIRKNTPIDAKQLVRDLMSQGV